MQLLGKVLVVAVFLKKCHVSVDFVLICREKSNRSFHIYFRISGEVENDSGECIMEL
jgi:hypothetical protein